tara:strand:+ start:73 stop:630 length:558 start_codon:yes stop_codon:yes gene_type:complete
MMNCLIKVFLVFILTLSTLSVPAYAARDTDSYDGNIFPIYAGNGSLVPPPNTLKQSFERHRTAVLVFYLDDNSSSKYFAPVVSGIKLLWTSSIDLLPITTDEIQGRISSDPQDESYYWDGKIPQVVVINPDGNVILSQVGQVPIETINEAISKATGLNPPDFTISIKSFNEYNSEPSKDGYTDPR